MPWGRAEGVVICLYDEPLDLDFDGVEATLVPGH